MSCLVFPAASARQRRVFSRTFWLWGLWPWGIGCWTSRGFRGFHRPAPVQSSHVDGIRGGGSWNHHPVQQINYDAGNRTPQHIPGQSENLLAGKVPGKVPLFLQTGAATCVLLKKFHNICHQHYTYVTYIMLLQNHLVLLLLSIKDMASQVEHIQAQAHLAQVVQVDLRPRKINMQLMPVTWHIWVCQKDLIQTFHLAQAY